MGKRCPNQRAHSALATHRARSDRPPPRLTGALSGTLVAMGTPWLMSKLTAGVVLFVLTASCSSAASGGLSTSTESLRPGNGRLVGRLGPGTPPANTVPATLALTFGSSVMTVQAQARMGVYRVDLPEGRWSVRSADGKVCALGILVTAGAWQRDDLIYPTASCQDLSGPPSPQLPPSPSTP